MTEKPNTQAVYDAIAETVTKIEEADERQLQAQKASNPSEDQTALLDESPRISFDTPTSLGEEVDESIKEADQAVQKAESIKMSEDKADEKESQLRDEEENSLEKNATTPTPKPKS